MHQVIPKRINNSTLGRILEIDTLEYKLHTAAATVPHFITTQKWITHDPDCGSPDDTVREPDRNPDEKNLKTEKKIKAKIIASVEYSKIFYFAPVSSRRMSSSRSEECIVEISSDEEDHFDHLRDGNMDIFN